LPRCTQSTRRDVRERVEVYRACRSRRRPKSTARKALQRRISLANPSCRAWLLTCLVGLTEARATRPPPPCMPCSSECMVCRPETMPRSELIRMSIAPAAVVGARSRRHGRPSNGGSRYLPFLTCLVGLTEARATRPPPPCMPCSSECMVCRPECGIFRPLPRRSAFESRLQAHRRTLDGGLAAQHLLGRAHGGTSNEATSPLHALLERVHGLQTGDRECCFVQNAVSFARFLAEALSSLDYKRTEEPLMVVYQHRATW
jgi:hypothetical protein